MVIDAGQDMTHLRTHTGKVTVVLNKAELKANAYRDFLDKVRPLLDKYASNGSSWNFGYRYVDYNGKDAASGVWTYPGFSTFEALDPEKNEVSFIFFSDYDGHGSHGEPPDLLPHRIANISEIFDSFLKFAEEVADATGYVVVVQKPYWLQLRQDKLEHIRQLRHLKQNFILT